MPENPIDRKLPVKYDPQLALDICEAIASGETLADIVTRPGMPSRAGIYRWLAVYPQFFDAYERAREVSAQSLEEEALLMARKLSGTNDFTAVKVSAYNIAMQQLRWSASRRDKARYGQQVQVAGSVPIQINTTLNLGQAGQPPATDIAQSIYTVEAVVSGGQPAITSGYDDDDVGAVTARGEVLDLLPNGDEDEATAFGVPATQTQQLHPTKMGRPKKGPRKSEAATLRTARAYAAKELRKKET